MIVGRNTLKGYLKRLLKPTEEQFSELIDSFVHKTEDASSMGVGEHNPLAVYMPNQIIIKDGAFVKAKSLQQGAFVEANWEPAFSTGISTIGTQAVIEENHQHIVYGTYTVEGSVKVDGQLIVTDFSPAVRHRSE